MTITLSQASVAMALLAAATTLFQHRARVSDLRLETVVGRMLAGSSLPTGALLIACAFRPELTKQLNEFHLYLAAAGVALLYVSVKELLKKPDPTTATPSTDAPSSAPQPS